MDGKPVEFELVRVAVQPEGAFGVLLMDGLPFLLTLERTYPVIDAKPRGPQFTKIPRGRYRCERTYYYRGGHETFEVTGVVGHSRLLFHRGNTESDSEGCILLGRTFGPVSGQQGVLDSRWAFDQFMRVNRDRADFDLEVRNA